MRSLFAFSLSTVLAVQTALADCSTNAMVVFDGSASMSEIGFDVQDATRIEEAREAMARAMPQVERFRRVGLLTYGPGGTDACSGLSLRFAPQEMAASRIQSELDALRPGGLTPLAAAVEQAAEALDYTKTRAVVVLITDGNETCGGTPCAAAQRMVGRSLNLTVHVVGFRVSRDFFAWNNPEQTFGEDTVAKCFADRTGGIFVTADTVDELVDALQQTLGCPVIGRVAPTRKHATVS